jgi:hypothetical protein
MCSVVVEQILKQLITRSYPVVQVTLPPEGFQQSLLIVFVCGLESDLSGRIYLYIDIQPMLAGI